jgi:hypothetical protein
MKSARAEDTWHVAPIGGEVRPELQTCLWSNDWQTACNNSLTRQNQVVAEDFARCVQLSHASWQWNNALWYPGWTTWPSANKHNALAAAASLGYQLELLEVKAARTTSFGYDNVDTISVTASLRNRGVAPPYYELALRFEYPCRSNQTSSLLVPLSRDLLMPSSTAKKVTGVLEPPAMAKGPHTLCVSLASSMARKPVKFAVNEVRADGRVLVFNV